MTENDERFIEIERNGTIERLMIDKMMKRTYCIAGRATTCWRVYCEGDPQTPLVIKDSWQYIEYEEKGELFREATERGIVNIVRYYYYKTVQILVTDDDVRGNVWKGLDVITVANYQLKHLTKFLNINTKGIPRKGRGINVVGAKRSSSQMDVFLPPRKRSCLLFPIKADKNILLNRVYQYVVLYDSRMPIYKVSSWAVLFIALKGYIVGYKSLYEVGFFYKNILVNNLIINEDNNNLLLPLFLIDLDLVIKEQREGISRVKGKTGIKTFIVIGALLNE